MSRQRGFDEVMIVNPYNPQTDTAQGVRLMPYHYGGPMDLGYYGDPGFAEYAEPWGSYGEHEPVGYYGE